MKLRSFIALIMSCLLLACQSKKDNATQPATLVHLPVVIKQGYGPFYPGFGFLTGDHPEDQSWGKMYLPVKGKPAHWSGVTKTMVWLSSRQLVYQNYRAGKISLSFYEYLQKNWKWTPDSTKLSDKPIKCFVYVLTGYDERRNQWAAMIDTNNNLDFSDETALYPAVTDAKALPDKISDVQRIEYEVYQKGKTVTAHASMMVQRSKNNFIYNFPQYGVATLNYGDKKSELYVSSGFGRPDFEQTNVIPVSSLPGSGRVADDELTPTGEYIEVGGTRYKNNGIDPFFNWLELEPVDPMASIYPLKAGFPFRPFAAAEFGSGRAISLQSLKGKFVFIDFWGTWCGPCRAAMPGLKEAYAKTNRNEIEFVGIVSNDTPDELRTYLKKEDIRWPQILSDETNKLVELNHITAYPTTVLLNPEGVIVAKNIRADQLQEFLKKAGN